jgi:putative thioredoxin
MTETVADWIFDVGEADFERLVLEQSKVRPVIVDFWAPWCGPCKHLGPLLERLIEERAGQMVLAKINVDDNQTLAADFQIQAIPAVKAFRGGQLALQFEGVLPEAQLKLFLDRLLPSEDEKQLNGAEGLEISDPAAAAEAYRAILAKEARNDAARVGLARVLIALHQFDEVPGILEPVAVEGILGNEAARLTAQLELARKTQGLPDEAALRQQAAAEPKNGRPLLELGTQLAARGQYGPALAALLEAAERDHVLASGPVREAMVQVFYALGSAHPLADEYRAKLARLLY